MKLRADRILWEPAIVAKIIRKHGVIPEEVEQVLFEDAPHIRKVSGNRYQGLGQTLDGRYLIVIFVVEKGWIKPLTARDMDDAERKLYRRSPKQRPEEGELDV